MLYPPSILCFMGDYFDLQDNLSNADIIRKQEICILSIAFQYYESHDN